MVSFLCESTVTVKLAAPALRSVLNIPRKNLQLVCGRERPLLKLGEAVERANFDECAYEKGCCLGRDG